MLTSLRVYTCCQLGWYTASFLHDGLMNLLHVLYHCLWLLQVLSEPSVSWKYELLYVPFILPFAGK
jgi:hypothetical protein